MKKNKIKDLIKNPQFIDFYSYREDKWLQNSDWEEKLIGIFGSIENAIKEFDKDEIFNTTINLKLPLKQH